MTVLSKEDLAKVQAAHEARRQTEAMFALILGVLAEGGPLAGDLAATACKLEAARLTALAAMLYQRPPEHRPLRLVPKDIEL